MTPAEWTQRIVDAQEADEPALYVTREEYVDLKAALLALDSDPHGWRPPSTWKAAVHLVGFPVVIDPEKAALQAARFGSSADTR